MKTQSILLPSQFPGSIERFFVWLRSAIVALLILLTTVAASALMPPVGEFLRRDPATAGRTTPTTSLTETTYVTRDRQGRATEVTVTDLNHKRLRTTKITDHENGTVTTITDELDRGTRETITWELNFDPRGDTPFVPVTKVTVRYDPVRKNPNGSPVVISETFRWHEGRWVLVPPPIEPVSQLGRPLEQLVNGGQVAIELTGSGETIGTVATLKLTNRSDQPLSVRVPPLLLVCGSGEYQHYACPAPQTVALKAKASKAVPLDGVCLVRGKLPVPKGKSGDLIAQNAEGRALNTASGKIKPFAEKKATTLLKTSAAYYQAAEKLQKQGAYKKMPYSNPQKQKEIAVQWGVWSDPVVAKISGEKPAAKEDLAKTIYKQAEAKGPMTPATKVKLDQGIDELFESIELTGKAAKEIASQPAAAAAKVSVPNGAKRHSCLSPDRLFSSSSGRSTSPAYDKAALLFPSQLL